MATLREFLSMGLDTLGAHIEGYRARMSNKGFRTPSVKPEPGKGRRYSANAIRDRATDLANMARTNAPGFELPVKYQNSYGTLRSLVD